MVVEGDMEHIVCRIPACADIEGNIEHIICQIPACAHIEWKESDVKLGDLAGLLTNMVRPEWVS